MPERVAAVVVTYNRRALLEQCLAGLRSQTRAPATIVVVDNCSTDGTAELLAAVSGGPGTPLHSVRTPENLGGAGGFALGMERALALDPDWLWLMDDDSVPEADSLERLLAAAEALNQVLPEAAPGQGRTGLQPSVGFLASRVLWKDGSPHGMNVPGRMSRYRARAVPGGLEAVDYASFVSLLVRREAVRACGLPIAEFFIGSDDVEYTWRLTRAGFGGYLVHSSRVRHLTADNAGIDVWNLPVEPGQLEKSVCKIRNLVAVNRRRPWGWLREGLRVVLLPLAWRLRGVGAAERRQLARGARAGLWWNYEALIRYPCAPSDKPRAPAPDAP